MIANQSINYTTSSKNRYPLPPPQSVMSSAEKLISCLGHMLSKLIQQAPAQINRESRFYCKSKPAISVSDYLKRIHRFANCSQYVFLKALIYMDRFQNIKLDFTLNEFSVHRQIVCAVMIATKYSQDFYYTNKHYSKVGGISQQEINKLEKQFLQTIDFSLYVKIQQLAEYQEKLNAYYQATLVTDELKGASQISPARTEGASISR